MDKLNFIRTIRFRLLSVTLLAVMGPLFIFSGLLNNLLWNYYIAQLDSQLESTGHVISENAVPILQGRGKQEALAEIAERWDRLHGIRIIVADKSGTVLAGTVGFASFKVGSPVEESFAPGLRAALQGNRNSTTWKGPDQDHDETMYVNLPISSSEGEILGAVRVSYSLGQVKNGVRAIRRTLLYGFGIYIVVLVLVTILLATSLARPVESLEKDAQIISSGHLEHKIKPYGPSEIQQLGHTLNRMTERLASLETQRRRYVSDVSHELRAPLAAIRTMTETLITHGEDDPELNGRYLPRIVSQTDRLARLASQLLDLAHIESGSTLQALDEVEVADLVSEVVHTAEQGAKDLGVTVRTDIEPGLPPIQADRDRLIQMLLNLVDNGISYTPSGSVVTVSAASLEDRLELRVEDNGPGIEASHIPHLFERFYRVDAARTPNRGGTGLGLSIVQRIVQAHRGEIEVESEVGKGTVFRITLPYSGTS